MGLIEAIILGCVQGLTEFLPISSTAHLRIVPALLGWKDPGAAFTAVVQLGTLAAVLIFFRSDLLRALKGWARSFGKSKQEDLTDAKLGWAIFIGSIPIVILGLVFKNQIKSDALRSLNVIGGMLILMGILLFVSDRIGTRKRMLGTVQPVDGLKIGLWQCVALIPGASRSGCTLTGAFLANFDRETAARFSFLLSIPSVLAAGLYEAFEARKDLQQMNLSAVLVATLVSFVVGYATIGFLLRFLHSRGPLPFIVYRVALGVGLILMVRFGLFQPLTGVH